MLYKILRHFLFLFNPEWMHDLVCFWLHFPLVGKILKLIYHYEHADLEREIFGLRFKNPVGLAAGFDKDAQLVQSLADLGFGFIEIGTVTPRPQVGNEKPRLFRLVRDEAVINRMGFNNRGACKIRENLLTVKRNVVIGGNIGKNKDTPNQKAIDDYLECFDTLYDVVDYFVINISSPNTPHLRELQEKEPLQYLCSRIQEQNRKKTRPKPVFLKIAPDLSWEQLDDIIEIVQKTGIAGIIATNTTVSRSGLSTAQKKIKRIGEGGLSGRPLRERATEIIRYIVTKSTGKIAVIGVGGIHSPQDAIEKLQAGAVLVQLYTGFIYEGPGLIKRIKEKLTSDYNAHP
jgi:dihydroorotate dehydrogenase